MKSIYGKLYQDFSFIENYGYHFVGNDPHYVKPSIVFENDTSFIQVGMDYEEGRMFVYFYKDKNICWNGLSVLANVPLSGRFYKNQVETVKCEVKKFLESI